MTQKTACCGHHNELPAQPLEQKDQHDHAGHDHPHQHQHKHSHACSHDHTHAKVVASEKTVS